MLSLLVIKRHRTRISALILLTAVVIHSCYILVSAYSMTVGPQHLLSVAFFFSPYSTDVGKWTLGSLDPQDVTTGSIYLPRSVFCGRLMIKSLGYAYYPALTSRFPERYKIPDYLAKLIYVWVEIHGRSSNGSTRYFFQYIGRLDTFAENSTSFPGNNKTFYIPRGEGDVEMDAFVYLERNEKISEIKATFYVAFAIYRLFDFQEALEWQLRGNSSYNSLYYYGYVFLAIFVVMLTGTIDDYKFRQNTERSHGKVNG